MMKRMLIIHGFVFPVSKALDDWEITNIEPFDKKNAPFNSLSDALVPYIKHDDLETAATLFLKEFYPEALEITKRGIPPVWVDPEVLAERLGLKIMSQRIREDASVFGQLYFVDTDDIQVSSKKHGCQNGLKMGWFF